MLNWFTVHILTINWIECSSALPSKWKQIASPMLDVTLKYQKLHKRQSRRMNKGTFTRVRDQKWLKIYYYILFPRALCAYLKAEYPTMLNRKNIQKLTEARTESLRTRCCSGLLKWLKNRLSMNCLWVFLAFQRGRVGTFADDSNDL